jgi:hypothetical protein
MIRFFGKPYIIDLFRLISTETDLNRYLSTPISGAPWYRLVRIVHRTLWGNRKIWVQANLHFILFMQFFKNHYECKDSQIKLQNKNLFKNVP